MCAVQRRRFVLGTRAPSGEQPPHPPVGPPSMLQKLLALALGVTVVGHLFFKPQLKQLGQRIDRIVTFMVIAIAITWLGQIVYFVLTRR